MKKKGSKHANRHRTPARGGAARKRAARVSTTPPSPFSLVFRCEPRFAVEDDPRPITLIAEFFPTGSGAFDVHKFKPIVRWFGSEYEKLEYGGPSKVAKTGAHYESTRGVESFTQPDFMDKPLPDPVLLGLHLSEREPKVVATFKLIVFSRRRLDSAKDVLIDQIRGKR